MHRPLSDSFALSVRRSQIEALELNENRFAGAIPTELLLLTNLDSLYLYGNNVSGPFTCPDFVEICGVSCNDTTLPECRELE